MTRKHNTTARLLTALATLLLLAGTASAQLPGLPGVGGVPDPAGLSPVDHSVSADASNGRVQACASAGASTATPALPGVPGVPGVPAPALPVAAPTPPAMSPGADLCVDSDDPQGSAMGAAAEAQEKAGEAQGWAATLQGWAQGLLGSLPF